MKLNSIRQWLKRLHKDTSGAMSVEKVLIIALISLPIIIALFLFRQKIVSWFTDNANELNNNP